MVGGEGHVHRGAELDTVTDVVIQSRGLGELIHLLPDDGTCRFIVTSTYAECSFFATTLQCDIIAMLFTETLHSIKPICVVREVIVDVGKFGVVVKLGNLSLHLCGIEEGFLLHHGVAVTVKHLVAVGLPSSRELIREVDLCGTTMTTTQLDFDDTICTFHTPLGSRGSILQHGNALDVICIHIQQGRELLFVVHVLEVDLLGVLGQFKDVVVDYNQWLCITIDGRCTTQAHRCTGTQVSRVGHNVETSDLSLQGLVDRLERQTFQVIHLHGTDGTGILALRNVETRGCSLFLCCNHSFLHDFHGFIHVHLIDRLVDGEGLVSVTHAVEYQLVLLVLDDHIKVTVRIRDGAADNTIVSVQLLDLNARYAAKLVRNGTADTVYLRAYRQRE